MSATRCAVTSSLLVGVVGALTLNTPALGAVPLAAECEPGWAGIEIGLARSQPTQPWSIARPSVEDTSPFMASVDRVAARSSNPPQTRRSLLHAIQMSTMCYAPDLSPHELDALIAATGLRPVTLRNHRDRFNLDTTIWRGDAAQGSSGKSARARLTYSFPADGTSWGLDSDFFSLPNSLNNSLATNFGFQDAGREWIRQGLAAWKHVAGVELDEVGDSGIPMDNVASRRSTVGDIRIGGNVLLQTSGGTNLAGVLAYNFFPTGGGDMLIDLAEFTPTRFNNSANNFRYFRNVVAHEHGHGLGFIHQVPCNNTKLMEPLVSTAYDVLQVDDRRGAAFGYGDRFSGNVDAARAANLGTFTFPVQPARFIQNLSIARQNDGPASGPNANDPSPFDWFKFTITSAQSITILMTPTGGTYPTGPQQTDPNNANNACFGASGSVNATSAIDLDLELRDTNGTTILATSTAGAGQTDGLTQLLNPGTYFIRVFSFTADPGSNVQLYNLQVGITAGLYVPEANAGLNKRVNVGELCQFIGDVNTVPGQFPINSYQWDLDGNGSLETNAPRPTTVYVTPGIRTVRLAVVDSNNGNGNDFIRVTVIGNAPAVTGISPASGTASVNGTTVPVTINGSSLGSPTVSISGTGVTITGTPAVDLANAAAPITGLSFVIAQDAPPGQRTVTVTTPSGTTTFLGFTVVQPATTVASISPSSGNRGTTVPIVINGANFFGQVGVTIGGTGATLSGTPVVNTARTQITGLSVVIDPNAPLGQRTITVNAVGGNATGTFTVTAPASANDLCANAIPINLGDVVDASNVGAGTEGAAPCQNSNSDVFYAFTPSCTGSYRFETAPTSFDTVLSVHSGCPAAAANSIACNDDSVPGAFLSSRVDVALTAGATYIIRAASFFSQGAFTLSVTPTTPVPNDACAGAINLPLGPTAFDTCLAASDPAAFSSCTLTAKDLWYVFTADRAGRTTVQTCGSLFDTVLEVFSSPCGSNTDAIACNDDSCGTSSSVNFVAAVGATYRVRVSGYNGFSTPRFGAGTLTRFCPADINLSSSLTVQDIFDFLAAYFSNAPTADYNNSGTTTVQDIFDYLAAYFAGC